MQLKSRAALFVAAHACLLPLFGQTPLHIQVDDARPLKAAVDVLESATGVAINYEDPRLTAPGDMRDITGEVQNARQRAANPNARIVVPKGGPLSLDFPAMPAPAGASDAMAVVNELRVLHEGKGYPGRFTVRQTGGAITIEPAAVRSSDGSWKAAAPAIETHISFPAQQRSAADALSAITGALSAALGTKVGVGRLPMVTFANASLTIGAVDEPANTVLIRLLQSMQTYFSGSPAPHLSYSFRLLYDPGVKYYLLHINTVQVAATATAATPPAVGPAGFLLQIPKANP